MASIWVSKTQDRGSIPRAPAKIIESAFLRRFYYFDCAWGAKHEVVRILSNL